MANVKKCTVAVGQTYYKNNARVGEWNCRQILQIIDKENVDPDKVVIRYEAWTQTNPNRVVGMTTWRLWRVWMKGASVRNG